VRYDEMNPVPPASTYGYMVMNNLGQLLPYCTQASHEMCELHAIDLWGEDQWARLQELGARIVFVEIQLLDCYSNRKAFHSE